MLSSTRLTRRSITGMLLGSLPLAGAPWVRAWAREATPSPRPSAIDIGENLEIRDVRLFPTEDVPRFLVELYSSRETMIDSPAIGLRVEDQSIWAVPYMPVTYANSSMLLIGVLPQEGLDLDLLLSPDWMLCAPFEGEGSKSRQLQEWDVSLEVISSVPNGPARNTMVAVQNNSDRRLRNVTFAGLVRDQDNRLCGATLFGNLTGMEPGEVKETGANLSPTLSYAANPLVLESNPEHLSIEFFVQPAFPPTQPNCPAVMTSVN